jgi:hypothetical protein
MRSLRSSQVQMRFCNGLALVVLPRKKNTGTKPVKVTPAGVPETEHASCATEKRQPNDCHPLDVLSDVCSAALSDFMDL